MNTGVYTQKLLENDIKSNVFQNEPEITQTEVIEPEIIDSKPVIKNDYENKIQMPYIKEVVKPSLSYMNLSYQNIDIEKEDKNDNEKFTHIFIIFILFLFLSLKAYEKKIIETDKLLFINTALITSFIISYYYMKLF